MKSRDEMVNSLFERRAQYQAEQKRKRNTLVKAVIPAFCVCLALVLGVGIWQSNTPDYISDTPSKSDTSVSASSDNTPDANKETIDMISSIEVDGVNYVQCSNVTQMYTPDTLLGDVTNFEGTYRIHIDDVPATLYTTKEDSDILIVKLQNGDYMFLAKEENE